MKISLPTCLLILIGAALVSACSEAPQPVASDKKPTHVWSNQVEALHQAKAVAKFADEQQKLNQQRLQELGVAEPR